jgi:hypothetical protein
MNTISRIIYPAFALVVLGSFALLRQVQAVVPPPDGGYPGFNTAEGQNAMFSLTTGVGNTADGWYSLFSNGIGSFNTAVGGGALTLNNADSNTAVGTAALLLNTTGTENTAVGTSALVNNDTGHSNTASGSFALSSNVQGNRNTALGFHALENNIAGSNIAVGAEALRSNTTGINNVAVGNISLENSIGGGGNTAVGSSALTSLIQGNTNTAVGDLALALNTEGHNNTAVGSFALVNSTGSGNVALGKNAGDNMTTADNVICIGSQGDATAFALGDRCFIGNIRGAVVGNGDGVNVIIDSDGQLGTVNSSRRFKKDIKSMDQTSEAILALKPVTFRYKDQDTRKAESTPQFGLIAEDVAEVNADLIVRDKEGKPLTVRYDAVNAMLLNEFLKEHRTVQEQGQELQRQAATIANQQKQIEALIAAVQKVSAQFKTNNSASQIAENNR